MPRHEARGTRRLPSVRVGAFVVGISAGALAIMTILVGFRPLASLRGAPAAGTSGAVAVDTMLTCAANGSPVENTPTLTATESGVPLTVWNGGGPRTLFVAMPSWMPYDDVLLPLEPGSNRLTVAAPTGQMRWACLDPGVSPDSIDPSRMGSIAVEDPNGWFVAPNLGCASPVRLDADLSAARVAYVDGTLDPNADLGSLVRGYLKGILPTDDIKPALYPADAHTEAVLVEREGGVIALLARPSAAPGGGEAAPLAARMVTCSGGGLVSTSGSGFA